MADATARQFRAVEPQVADAAMSLLQEVSTKTTPTFQQVVSATPAPQANLSQVVPDPTSSPTQQPQANQLPTSQQQPLPNGQANTQTTQSDQSQTFDYPLNQKTQTQTTPSTDPNNPQSQVPGEPNLDVDELLDAATKPKKGPQESWKELRVARQRAEEEARTAKEKLTELESKVQKYESGEALPSIVEELRQEINHLKQFESLYNVEASPEFKETYIEPAENVKTQFKTLCKEYEIPEEVAEEALQIKSKRERNQFLSEHFDSVGAVEAKGLIDQFESINNQREEAKKAPTETLAQLNARKEAAEIAQKNQALTRIYIESKSGWSKAIESLTQGDKFPELTVTGNPKHDDISIPVLRKAGEEFGKFIKSCVAYGATNMDPAFLEVMATRFLLSEASMVASETRRQFYEIASQFEQENKRLAPLARPPIGSNGGMSAPVAPAQQRIETPKDAANDLLRQVGVRV